MTGTLESIRSDARRLRMTSDRDNGSRRVGDRARTRAYHRDFWPGILGYVVVLTAV